MSLRSATVPLWGRALVIALGSALLDPAKLRQVREPVRYAERSEILVVETDCMIHCYA